MRDIIDAPTGPAVEICELLGIPFARLRFALPDEMLSWDMPVALGRMYGLSKSGWEMMAADLKEKLPSLFGSFRRSRQVRTSQLDPAVAEEMERARQAMNHDGGVCGHCRRACVSAGSCADARGRACRARLRRTAALRGRAHRGWARLQHHTRRVRSLARVLRCCMLALAHALPLPLATAS
jgi:hypothetical protein